MSNNIKKQKTILLCTTLLIVDAEIDCKIGYLDGDKYAEITSSGNSYVVPDDVKNVIILLNGDLNGDTSVDITDATTLYNALKGKTTLDTLQKFMADVNSDGSSNFIDVMMTLNKI